MSSTPKKSSPILENCDAPLQYEYEGESTDRPTVGFIYSCAERGVLVVETSKESIAARSPALSQESFELENGPAELEEICNECRQRLGSYSRASQTLTVSGCAGRGGPWQRLVIKEDEASRFRERLGRSAWASRLTKTDWLTRLQR